MLFDMKELPKQVIVLVFFKTITDSSL